MIVLIKVTQTQTEENEVFHCNALSQARPGWEWTKVGDYDLDHNHIFSPKIFPPLSQFPKIVKSMVELTPSVQYALCQNSIS